MGTMMTFVFTDSPVFFFHETSMSEPILSSIAFRYAEIRIFWLFSITKASINGSLTADNSSTDSPQDVFNNATNDFKLNPASGGASTGVWGRTPAPLR